MTPSKLPYIEPPDCFVRAVELAADVELIRREMGRATDPRPAVVVTGASPRECWFQAHAVFRKADRLCQEIAHDPVASMPYAPPISQIKPGHVLGVIDAAAREVDEVKAALGIVERGEAPRREPARTPSDVFGVLASVNRQINLLLERPFSPADVFQQVSLAVAYAARIAGTAPPARAAHERGKRPADCYDRLSACLELTRVLVKRAGQPVIEQAPAVDGAIAVQPSDCYDLASLLVAEVVFLHGLEAGSDPVYPFEANAPGRKLPSHVWQLVGVLEQQLTLLAR